MSILNETLACINQAVKLEKTNNNNSGSFFEKVENEYKDLIDEVKTIQLVKKVL